MVKYTSFKVAKLVRDKALENLTAEGALVDHEHLPRDKIELVLKDKILEEAREIIEGETKEAIAEEIADLMEVILTYMDHLSITREEVEAIRAEKTAKTGAFKNALYIQKITVEEGSLQEAHFLRQPHKYPVL
jgi:predicted house-cleaning noncanonical NTP pyrophosphatase (MazG superfamily)